MTRAALGSAWGLDTEPADDWRHRAACRGEDPELFFPIGTSGPALEQVEQAKAVCRRCSVIDQCLRWALDRPEEFGIWGGLTEDERRALKVTRRKSICTSCSMRDVTITMQNGSRVSVCEACGISEPW